MWQWHFPSRVMAILLLLALDVQPAAASSLVFVPLPERVAQSDALIEGVVAERTVLEPYKPGRIAGPPWERIKLRLRIKRALPAQQQPEIEVTGNAVQNQFAAGSPIILLQFLSRLPGNPHPEDTLHPQYAWHPDSRGAYWFSQEGYQDLAPATAWQVLLNLYEKSHKLPVTSGFDRGEQIKKLNTGTINEAQFALALLRDILAPPLTSEQLFEALRQQYETLRAEGGRKMAEEEKTKGIKYEVFPPPGFVEFRPWAVAMAQQMEALAGPVEIEKYLELYTRDRSDKRGNAFDDFALENLTARLILKLPAERWDRWLQKLLGRRIIYYGDHGGQVGSGYLIFVRYDILERIAKATGESITALKENYKNEPL